MVVGRRMRFKNKTYKIPSCQVVLYVNRTREFEIDCLMILREHWWQLTWKVKFIFLCVPTRVCVCLCLCGVMGMEYVYLMLMEVKKVSCFITFYLFLLRQNLSLSRLVVIKTQ